jgi:hypothetical protein
VVDPDIPDCINVPSISLNLNMVSSFLLQNAVFVIVHRKDAENAHLYSKSSAGTKSAAAKTTAAAETAEAAKTTAA